MTTNDYEEAVIHIAAIVGNANNLHERLERATGLSQVTIAKAAETDRLTDENRRLRAKVEDSEAKVHALAKDLAERDSEIAKLQLKNANLQYKLDEHRAVAATPAPDYVTRAELVKVLRETAFTGIAADFLEGLVFAP